MTSSRFLLYARIAVCCAFVLASSGEILFAEDQATKEPTTLRELIDAAIDDAEIFADD